MARVRDLYRELSPIPCTSCRYCMPCPQGVAIPEVFDLYNDAHMYDEPAARSSSSYRVFSTRTSEPTSARPAASAWTKCPQGIAVPDWLEKAQAFLGAAP